MKSDITVVVLTKNEEANMQRALENIKDFAERIVVVDSGSTDRTLEIAKEYGADIYSHSWKHYADQFNWALKNTDISTTWVYRLDADEVPTPELKAEMLEAAKNNTNSSTNAFLIRYKIFFLGKFLKHGGAYPILKISLFKPRYSYFENRAMGEHVLLTEGICGELKNDCLHYDFKDLDAYINKHNSYASREVIDYYERRERIEEQATQLYKTAERTKKLRDGLYYRLPMFIRAKLYYWFRYYVQRGFLDGKEGKIYCFIQSYFYRFVIDAKIYEREIGKENK